MYVLTTSKGQLRFYVKQCAELYQGILDGVITCVIEETSLHAYTDTYVASQQALANTSYSNNVVRC